MDNKTKSIILIALGVLIVVNTIIGITLSVIQISKGRLAKVGMPALIGNVGIIDVNGIIVSDTEDFLSDYTSASKVAEDIRTFADTPTIKAIRINVSSPGGTVSGAETIVSAIEYAKNKGKKVVVYMKELAASGGYYISASADYIIASYGTLTGSIGVIVQSMNIKELLDKVGIKTYVFKSGKHKDILSPYREPSEDEKKMIQSIVEEYYNRFIEVILKHRSDKLSKNELLKIADGRILSENQALKAKLIDDIGDEQKLEETLKKLIGDEIINYVRIPKKRNLIKEILGTIVPFKSISAFKSPTENYLGVYYIMN